MNRPDELRTEIAAAREALAARQSLLQSTVASFNDRLRDGHARLPGRPTFAQIGFEIGNLHRVASRIEKSEFDAGYLLQVGGIKTDEVHEALALRESLSELRDEIAQKQVQLSLFQ